jgi:hypothetical protein
MKLTKVLWNNLLTFALVAEQSKLDCFQMKNFWQLNWLENIRLAWTLERYETLQQFCFVANFGVRRLGDKNNLGRAKIFAQAIKFVEPISRYLEYLKDMKRRG